MLEEATLKVAMYCQSADVYYMKEIRVPISCECLSCGGAPLPAAVSQPADLTSEGRNDGVNFGGYGSGSDSQYGYQEPRGPRNRDLGHEQVSALMLL